MESKMQSYKVVAVNPVYTSTGLHSPTRRNGGILAPML